jgi:hypothetical protein
MFGKKAAQVHRTFGKAGSALRKVTVDDSFDVEVKQVKEITSKEKKYAAFLKIPHSAFMFRKFVFLSQRGLRAGNVKPTKRMAWYRIWTRPIATTRLRTLVMRTFFRV